MPLDSSILNIGEYYSSHYLDTTFAGDLREQVRAWREAGSAAPPRKLAALGPMYFRAKAEALEIGKPGERWRAGRELAGWHARLLDALGYTDRQPLDLPVEGGGSAVPILTRVHRYHRPWLVVAETPFCLPEASLKDGQPDENPLELPVLAAQLADATVSPCAGDWSRAIGRLLTEEDAPRWVLLLGGSRVLLIDRHTRAQGRWLAFDLDDAYGRAERATFEHLAAFLAADTLCPGGETDQVLHDRLEAQSHRFAHGVTDSLQFAVRETIELLAREWIADRRRRQLAFSHLDGSPITAEQLKHEALITVYRLLFCFYAEARGAELGILPINDDAYRLGYSLEALRDLEQVPLTPITEQGHYFHEHLKRLFGLIHAGFHTRRGGPALDLGDGGSPVFSLRPLTATLFDPAATPLLNQARLSNHCLQQVIQKLSLSTDERTRSLGRVNYAELGINQLGAVYEGLLVYRATYAERDLIHVKPANGAFFSEVRAGRAALKTARDTPTWFAPADRLEEFAADEIERESETSRPRIYKKGEFVLHIAGLDRENSASYYTPEALTRTLVREALDERLRDFTPERADELLAFRLCEMAMGSAAFLNEAADQLAQRYLELKQRQLGRRIDPSDYPDERRRARHYLATRGVYGVDLNATAVELGALSLWLGSSHRLRVAAGDNGGPDRFQPGATA